MDLFSACSLDGSADWHGGRLGAELCSIPVLLGLFRKTFVFLESWATDGSRESCGDFGGGKDEFDTGIILGTRILKCAYLVSLFA